MPCYEFECKRCKEHFDITCSFADRDLPVDCPLCGKRGAGVRVFSSVRHYWNEDESLGLKGTGLTRADAMSITEKAKAERGVWGEQ